MRDRRRLLRDAAARRYDVIVIGGGINGAGIARDAAARGLAVLLLEKHDWGFGTTWRSTKLIHGGLRYLRLGDVRLVREAHEERRALMHVVAPHLVRPLPFLLPLYEAGPYRPLTVRAGVWLYETLARERFGGLVSADRARRSVPSLRVEGLRGCVLYADACTHDARLCLANVRAAADAGATVANYAEVVSLRLEAGRASGAEVRDALGGDRVSVRARAVVNATGPWVDRVRRLEDPSAAASSRLSKGVHALLPLEGDWSAAVTIPHDKVRVSFAVPWEGMLLVGTTDTPYDGDPAEVHVTEEDVAAVLAEAAVALDSDRLRPEAVRSSFAGLRVLPGADGETASARRETVFLRGPAGMLSVAGGKLTTYRRIALAVLALLRADLALHRIERTPAPLPGAADPADTARGLVARHPALEPRTAAHLAHLYGGLADDVVDVAGGHEDVLAPLHPDGPDIGAQVLYAGRHEWAETAEDVLARRTTLSLRGLDGPDVVARVGALLAASAAPSRG